MKRNDCNTIRRELEELEIGEDYDAAVLLHLKECATCREFQRKHTNLRRLVGSIGTIEAPADFEFRLRARLAKQKDSATYRYGATRWLLHPALASAAALVFVLGVVFFVRHSQNQAPSVSAVASDNSQKAERNLPVAVTTPNVKAAPVNADPAVALNGDSRATPKHRNAGTTVDRFRNKRSIVSTDFSGTRAPVFPNERSLAAAASPAFPIDASVQPWTVLLDDGRGNARTISLPGVSFGSQRVFVSGNQLAPKAVW